MILNEFFIGEDLSDTKKGFLGGIYTGSLLVGARGIGKIIQAHDQLYRYDEVEEAVNSATLGYDSIEIGLALLTLGLASNLYLTWKASRQNKRNQLEDKLEGSAPLTPFSLDNPYKQEE